MGRLLLASLALIAMFAVGCTGDPEPIEPSDPTPSSTTPTSDIEPPTLPEAAKQETAEGASSFVDYYLEVLNYASHTGDTELLGDLSAETCDGCDAYVAQFDSRAEAGGWRKGGEWSAGTITVSQYGPDLALVTQLNSTSGTYQETASSEPLEFDASTEVVTFVVGYDNSQWQVIEFALGDQT